MMKNIKSTKAKPTAKKAPAKMAMKKPAVKKAQDGLKTDSTVVNNIAKSLEKRKSEPRYNAGQRLSEQREKEYKDSVKAEQQRKAKAMEKSLKDQGFDPSKLKNGGRTKK